MTENTDDDALDGTEPSEDELAEAEALSRALERGAGDPSLPDDAFQTAALLRYSQDEGVLSREREDALLDDVLASADRVAARAPAPATPSLFARFRWLFGATGLSLVAATALLLFFYGRPRPSEPTPLPPPDVALLGAQITRATGGGDDAELDRAMRAYRGDVYTALRTHYETR